MKSTNAKQKFLLIGWDGADWQHITPMLDQGLLPGLESLVNRGVMGNLATLQPVLSPMLWNSIATGKTADKHGIHGFVEPLPDKSGVRPATSTSRKTKAIWNILNQNQWRSNVVSWWASYPAEPINGHVITNLFNAVKRDEDGNVVVGPHVIHPASEAVSLAESKVDISEITVDDIGPFCPNYMKVDQDKDQRLKTLAKLISDCASIQSVTTTLMAKDDWDFTAVYFDSIDHFCHAFMQYHPPRMPNVTKDEFEIYQDVIQGAYRLSDMMLQQLIHLAGPDATILLCSDHGFQSGRGRPLVTPMEPAGPALWHRSHGIFVMAGKGIKQDERVYGASIIDIAPTILHAVGLPVGEDMDGRVLLDAFTDSTPPKMIPSWDDVSGDDGCHPQGYDAFAKDDSESGEKQDDLIKQFVALGYIEDPGDNREQAAENASLELKYNLARVYYSTNRFDAAMPLFHELVVASPWEDRYWKNLAYCCYELKRYSEAQEIIERLYPGDEKIPPFSKLILAQCAWAFGERDKAHAFVDQLLASELRVANVYGSLGQLLVSDIRDFDKAEKAFSLCKTVDPDYANAYEGLAGVYYRTKRYDECIDAALHAVALMYRLPKAHLYLGLALDKKGDADNAIIAFDRVCKFNHRKFKLLALRQLISIHRSKQNHKLADEYSFQMKQLRGVAKRTEGTKIERLVFPDMPSYEERKKTNDVRRGGKKHEKVASSGKTMLLVSGLPRSGTSLMMQMLRAGGIDPQTDGLREADENNPKGYYEWEAIKGVGGNPEILDEEGIEQRSIKVISMLLPFLPKQHKYKVIFMMRPISQIATSQAKMIERLETSGAESSQQEIEKQLAEHRTMVLNMLEKQSGVFDFITVNYEDLLSNSDHEIARVAKFVGDDRLDQLKMPTVVQKNLHRER